MAGQRVELKSLWEVVVLDGLIRQEEKWQAQDLWVEEQKQQLSELNKSWEQLLQINLN